jgi:long-chain acyl-CoA synthetase
VFLYIQHYQKKDYTYVVNYSDEKYCFISDAGLYEKVWKVQNQTPLKNSYSLEVFKAIYSWKAFLEIGKDTNSEARITALKAAIEPTDLTTIIYTSGTTGTPKGVMLSYKNVVDTIFKTHEALNLVGNKKRVISYLPISHIFERSASYYYQYRRFEVYFPERIEKLGENIKEVKPHFLAVVPRLFEKIFDNIIKKGSTLRGLKEILFF